MHDFKLDLCAVKGCCYGVGSQELAHYSCLVQVIRYYQRVKRKENGIYTQSLFEKSSKELGIHGVTAFGMK